MDDEIARRVINVKDVPTKTVTLYPSRAHIVREITDVTLRAGQNELEIYGVTPTADEQSLQVDGRGSAIITDMTVDLVPNRESFEDVYPDESDNDSDDDTLSDSDREEEKAVADIDAQIDELDCEQDALKVKKKAAAEKQSSAEDRLSILKSYTRTLHAKDVDAEAVSKALTMYEGSRKDFHSEHAEAAATIAAIAEQIDQIAKRRRKLEKKREWAWEKAYHLAEKERSKKRRRKDLDRKEAERIRTERLKFWPMKLYRIVLRLEPSSLATPTMSRRNSIDSVTLADTPMKDDGTETGDAGPEVKVSLSLSYVTSDAQWNPRYDLSVSSTKKSVTISYRAEFTNFTSETWKDAKVFLSTSQTSYSGLKDTVPTIQPWRMKLVKPNSSGLVGQHSSLLTWQERSEGKQTVAQQWKPAVRSNLFGQKKGAPAAGGMVHFKTSKGFGGAKPWAEGALLGGNTNNNNTNAFASNNAFAQPSIPPGGSLFGSTNNTNSLFDQTSSQQQAQLQAQQQQQQQQQRVQMQMMQAAAPGPDLPDYQAQLASLEQENGRRLRAARADLPAPGLSFGSRAPAGAVPPSPTGAIPRGGGQARRGQSPISEGDDSSVQDYDGEESEMAHEEAQWQDNGMTATFEIPSTRTLAPSSLTRRHKIATIQASNADIAYVAVPKLRAAAFLRVKIRNPSSGITLLKGSAGVRLDGSFLGNMTLQRASPGQMIELPLGVDAGVHVSYPKPSVRRSTLGIFNKDSAEVYSRSIWLMNTKSAPITLRVVDQVPVSEDERLRIDVATPKGLKAEGGSVRAGVSAKEASMHGGSGSSSGGSGAHEVGTAGTKWGSATATMKKNGEVVWEVKMEKGGACLLGLEYEAKLPASEQMSQA